MRDPDSPLRGEGCPAASVLELFSAGDTVDVPVGEHLRACPGCRAHVEDLRAAHLEFKAANPGERLVQKLIRRESTAAPRARWRWVPMTLLGIAGAATLALLVFPRLPPADDIRLKGQAPFGIYAKREGAEPSPLPTGSRVAPGDVLRFRTAPRSDGFLMIVNLDGRRRLSAFHPYGETAVAVPVRAGESGLLPGGVATDAAQGPERIGAIFRPRPFTLTDVKTWLSDDGTNGVPRLTCSDCETHWIVLEK